MEDIYYYGVMLIFAPYDFFAVLVFHAHPYMNFSVFKLLNYPVDIQLFCPTFVIEFIYFERFYYHYLISTDENYSTCSE